MTYIDTVEWVQHPEKTGVFFHEENIFSLWTMKIMDFSAQWVIHQYLIITSFNSNLLTRKHMVVFLCIDYTIWPGWNHRGVYLYSREPEFKVKIVINWLFIKDLFDVQDKIPRKLSDKAHRRMKMVYDRRVNTTICNPDDWLPYARPRWHPHKQINQNLIRYPIYCF